MGYLTNSYRYFGGERREEGEATLKEFDRLLRKGTGFLSCKYESPQPKEEDTHVTYDTMILFLPRACKLYRNK